MTTNNNELPHIALQTKVVDKEDNRSIKLTNKLIKNLIIRLYLGEEPDTQIQALKGLFLWAFTQVLIKPGGDVTVRDAYEAYTEWQRDYIMFPKTSKLRFATAVEMLLQERIVTEKLQRVRVFKKRSAEGLRLMDIELKAVRLSKETIEQYIGPIEQPQPSLYFKPEDSEVVVHRMLVKAGVA